MSEGKNEEPGLSKNPFTLGSVSESAPPERTDVVIGRPARRRLRRLYPGPSSNTSSNIFDPLSDIYDTDFDEQNMVRQSLRSQIEIRDQERLQRENRSTEPSSLNLFLRGNGDTAGSLRRRRGRGGTVASRIMNSR